MCAWQRFPSSSPYAENLSPFTWNHSLGGDACLMQICCNLCGIWLQSADTRYLSCPPGLTINHLNKFIALKFGLAKHQQVCIRAQFRAQNEPKIWWKMFAEMRAKFDQTLATIGQLWYLSKVLGGGCFRVLLTYIGPSTSRKLSNVPKGVMLS